MKKNPTRTIGKIFLPLLFSSLCLCLFSAHAAFFIGIGIPFGHTNLGQEASSDTDIPEIKDAIKELNDKHDGGIKVDLIPGVDFQLGIDLSKISIRTPFRLSVNLSMLHTDDDSFKTDVIDPISKTTVELQYLLPVTKTETIAVGGYMGKEKWKYYEAEFNPIIPSFTVSPAIRGVSIALIAQLDDKGSAIEVGYKRTLSSSTVKQRFKTLTTPSLPLSLEHEIKSDDMFYIHYIYSFGHKSESEDV